MFLTAVENLLRQPRPNYVDPVEHGPELWITTPFFLTAALVCVTARLYSRIFVRRWFGLDDLLIILALLFSIGVNVCVGLGITKYGWKRHVWDVPMQWWSTSAKLFYVLRNFWGLASSCVRLSVLVLYYRLVKSSRAPRSFLLVLHAVAGLNIGILVLYIIVGIFPCHPIRGFWAFPPIDSKCFDEGKMELAIALLNTFSEFLIATLPLLAVFKLGVDQRQRWNVISLLCLGYGVGFVGCVRTYYIYKSFSGWQDVTWWSYPQWICSDIEIDVALICACAAPLKPLIGRIRRQFRRMHGRPSAIARSLASSRNKHHTNGTQDSEAQLSRDFDTVPDWPSTMRRAFDIEGIAIDGYAYSVTISGPPRQRKPLTERFWLKNSKADKPVERMVEGGKAGLEISHQTEVTVRHSFHSPGTRSAMSHRPATDQIEIEMRATPDIMKRSDSSALEKEMLIDEFEASFSGRETFLDDAVSVESLEALPTMPPAATQPPPGHVRRVSLNRMLPSHRRLQG